MPSVEEQQFIIVQDVQKDEQESEPDKQAVEDISERDNKDEFLLNISDNDKARITEQFKSNPRSREAVNLIKEVYGDIPIPQAIKRISELISEGKFTVVTPKPELHLKVAGDFYELYGDEAKAAADILDLTLTSRNGEPMVGFPSHSLENYLKRLIEAGYAVLVPETLKETEQTTELDFDTVANTVLTRVMADTEYIEHLKTAESRSSLRNICSAAVERIIGEHQADEPYVFSRFNSDDDFNEDINSYVLRQSWLNKPKLEVVAEIPVAEPAAEQTEQTETAALAPSSSPPPVFVVDWQQAQHDFNLNLYKDRDIIAYDKDGVQHALGRSGNVTYVTSTGAFWGSNEVPADIYEQINDYKDGKLTAEQVRENYLKILADFKPQKEKADTGIKMPTAIDSAEQQSFDEPKKPQHTMPVVKGHNFRITDDHLGEGGAKIKFRNNINALKTLVNIESENRAATSEEQETLSRYVGWGGVQQAFDPDNKDWENEYRELKDLLTTDEWESARATVLNAHYTSPLVIKAIYETIERLGFKNERSAGRGYNILEPSLGVGNFFGLLPDSMKSSKLYGTELDNVTARIAKYLYPNAEILNMPYENTQYSDAFFDIAIGNVPFGGFGVIDNRYKTNFNIHDYFFQKTLDKVRPGGIIAFITSKGTLDKKNPEARKYIAQRAELLGAVRLPNNAFLKNAGTEATTDIIFLQKRDRPIDIRTFHLSDDKCEWVNLGLTDDGLPINRYFLDNPEMLLGRMTNESGSRMYGDSKSTTCEPIEGADLAQQLKTALSYVEGQYTLDEIDDMDGIDNNSIPADPNVKNFSYTEVDGKVYFRENSLMYPVDLPVTTLERIKGMIHLRDCVHELINLQLNENTTDETIKKQQANLNILYDKFTSEFGLISSQANNRAFNADSAYYLLSSLEILDENGNLERKADMFTKRTIKPKIVITHVDTASEALAVSIGEKACVDIEYMSELTGFSPETLIKELEGVIFFDYGNPNRDLPPFDSDKMKVYEKFPLVTADEYLSGNVREKLEKAKRFNEAVGDEFQGFSTVVNIAALTEVQPKDLEPGEISVRLGATWIDAKYVEQFMHELLDTSWRNKNIYQVKYHKCTGEWQVTGKNKAQYSDINATVTYGTSRMNAYQIIDDTLNLRDVRIYDYVEDADGKERRVLNKKETMLAQQKQDTIKRKFSDWIWQDPQRRQTLVKKYNELFNSTRTRQYDGSHITFSGMNPEIKLSKHQVDGAARYLYGGNTLYAHVVGAGKTFTMIAGAMESKRLGLCHKSLFAVPNHLTEQWAAEFLRLYPSANILVATKKDFEMRNRKKFCAKIATGEYDAVIIGHTQLEKIPMSRERQERQIREQIDEIEIGICELKNTNGERYSIKQLEKTKRNLELKLRKLLESKKRDDVVTFEQLGVDRLYVDEAHNFKNLFLYTKMRNVAGLSTTEAQKSTDLFMKCRYMDEITNNKGVIFATGTPKSTLYSYLKH